jgi:hypothetical protein|tara:strand:+ start:167 stop:379 length:213 start_codon:yes stop_codon:yes gene_type:complete
MKYLICIVFLFLYACDERVRYFCQDPKNFSAKRCQRPDCQFSQDCPDYLVAPILEKQAIVPAQTTSEPQK